MSKAIPVIAVDAGALFLMGGKKKKKASEETVASGVFPSKSESEKAIDKISSGELVIDHSGRVTKAQ